MKRRNMKLRLLGLFIIMAIATQASGILIVGDATLQEVDWRPGYDYEIFLSQSSIGLFSVWVTALDDNEFLFSYAGIAELYALYDVEYGIILDPDFVAHTEPLLTNYEDPFSFSITLPLYQHVYFGYWDERQGSPDNPSIFDSYGWFLLENTEDGLVLWDSATAIGYGIIVGTYQQIPEPGTTALLLLGAGSLVLAHKKRSSKTTPTTRG